MVDLNISEGRIDYPRGSDRLSQRFGSIISRGSVRSSRRVGSIISEVRLDYVRGSTRISKIVKTMIFDMVRAAVMGTGASRWQPLLIYFKL